MRGPDTGSVAIASQINNGLRRWWASRARMLAIPAAQPIDGYAGFCFCFIEYSTFDKVGKT